MPECFSQVGKCWENVLFSGENVGKMLFFLKFLFALDDIYGILNTVIVATETTTKT